MKNNIFIFLTLSFFIFSCEKLVWAEEQSINIGALLVLTGQYAMQGNAFREGIELAEDSINQSGGINGKKLNVIIEDTVNDSKKALSAAKKLASIDHVSAALMSSYPEYKTGGIEFQHNKIPAIALWDSSPELEEMGDYIFAIGPWAPSSGESAAEFAKEKIKAKTAVVIASIDPWAELVAGYFETSFTERGGKVLQKIFLNPDTTDFRVIFTKVKALKPDVIYAPITENIPIFHAQKRALAISVPVISSDVIAEEHISKGPADFEGVYQTGIKDPDNSRSKELFQKYEKKFSHPPTLPWFVSVAYDGVMILAQAIKEVGSNGEKINSYLYTLKDYPGTTQNFTFNSKRSAPQIAGMNQIKGGKFVWIWPEY